MTFDDIDTMTPGPILDALIHEHIMGRQRVGLWDKPPAYSSDIAIAWQVVEELSSQLGNGHDPRWRRYTSVFGMLPTMDAEKAALRICQHALLEFGDG
mgnify:CR=1 FL=1